MKNDETHNDGNAQSEAYRGGTTWPGRDEEAENDATSGSSSATNETRVQRRNHRDNQSTRERPTIDKLKAWANSLTPRSKKFAFQIILLIGVLGFFWYVNRTPDNSSALEGKIFAFKLYLRPYGKYSNTGYIAFGGKSENYGVLWYLAPKKAEVDKLNEEGEIASQLTSAYKSHLLYWDIGDAGTSITFPNGLSFPADEEHPFRPSLEISIDKVSGIFNKTVYGTYLNTDDDGNTDTVKVKLVQVGRIKQ